MRVHHLLPLLTVVALGCGQAPLPTSGPVQTLGDPAPAAEAPAGVDEAAAGGPDYTLEATEPRFELQRRGGGGGGGRRGGGGGGKRHGGGGGGRHHGGGGGGHHGGGGGHHGGGGGGGHRAHGHHHHGGGWHHFGHHGGWWGVDNWWGTFGWTPWWGLGVRPWWWGSYALTEGRLVALGAYYYPFYLVNGMIYPDFARPYVNVSGAFWPVSGAMPTPANQGGAIAAMNANVVNVNDDQILQE